MSFGNATRTAEHTGSHTIPIPISLSLSLSPTPRTQAAKAEKPQKHRVRRTESRGDEGPLIPNSPGYTPTNVNREYTPRKAEKLSTQDMIAQELAEMQGGED